MQVPDPILCSAFVFLAFVMAGIAQTLWLKSELSRPFGIALDGGRTFRGRRLLGDNKTWRGFVVMVPAVSLSFILTRFILASFGGVSHGPWSLSVGAYLMLGAWTGFAFMLAELPNSFIKRQWDIAPGDAATHPLARPVCFTLDQVDSIIGGLIALSLFVPVPMMSWFYILVIGAVVHWVFNCVLMLIGLKTRAA